jgi:acyl carrier protein
MKRDEAIAMRSRVREFIIDNFYVADAARLADEASLIATGVMDSTGVLEVIAFLEAEFGIVIADHEVTPENLETIERIAAFVARK